MKTLCHTVSEQLRSQDLIMLQVLNSQSPITPTIKTAAHQVHLQAAMTRLTILQKSSKKILHVYIKGCGFLLSLLNLHQF